MMRGISGTVGGFFSEEKGHQGSLGKHVTWRYLPCLSWHLLRFVHLHTIQEPKVLSRHLQSSHDGPVWGFILHD